MLQQQAEFGHQTTTVPASSRAALIGIGALMSVLTNAVVFVLPPLLPVIQARYGLATVAETTWLYTALTLGGAAGFILLPRLADLHGDRNASSAACVFLTGGALIPAVGDSYLSLLVGCVLMGFGGAAQLLPLGFLRRGLGEAGTTVGVAVLVIATGIGIVVGMIGGGVIVQSLSLPSFFGLLSALCAVTTLGAHLVIPHDPPAERSGRIGALGTLWMMAWVAAILLTLTQGLVWGVGALVPLALGVGGGIAWVRVERTSSSAVFDVGLMRTPRVTTACVCLALFAAVTSAFLLLLSTYVQTVPDTLRPSDAYGMGLNAVQTGWLMVPFAVTFLVGGAIVERPVANGRGLTVFVVGALITAASLGFLAVAHEQKWHYLVGGAVMGLGCSIGFAAGFTMVQMAVPEEKAGMAAGVAGTFMAVGFAFGTALVSADLSAVLVPVRGSTVEIAAQRVYGPGYWLSGFLALLAVVTVMVSRARTRRLTPAVP